jgi:uncharacterized sulfatase
VRDEVANYYATVHLLDGFVGDVLARLEREGLAKNTVVMFFADNGRAMVRSKQWLYDGGVHVPSSYAGRACCAPPPSTTAW